jgi:hypothetical protein
MAAHEYLTPKLVITSYATMCTMTYRLVSPTQEDAEF